MNLPRIPVSLLDRANARVGSSPGADLAVVLERARRAEALGFHRFWVAEHHAVPGIVGSAPTLLMAAIAAQTQQIRVGSGGVMLPNHQPLVVAEQIGTLQALHPGRIDLGIGRSVAFTEPIRAALRQDLGAADRFDADLAELLSYLSGTAPITARPADGGATPPFVLAMGRGVEYAAPTGLAVVVGGAAFSGPRADEALERLQRYRDEFVPSTWWPEPYVMVAVNVAVGDTPDAARELLLPEAWSMAAARTLGDFTPLISAAAVSERTLTTRQHGLITDHLAAASHGTPDEIGTQVAELVRRTGADELLVTTNTFDPEALWDNDRRLAELFGTPPIKP